MGKVRENMKSLWSNMQIALSTMGGFLGWFLGGIDGFLYALTAFVIVDYLTGVMLAIIEKRVSSVVGARGIFKKVLIFTLVGVAHIVDSQIIGEGSVICTAVIFFYLSNEGISILENTAKIGLPIPEKLKDALVQLKEGKK